MANTGFKGLSVRQTGTAILCDALLQNGSALVTSGTTTLRLYELQSDGTIKTFDFATSTFTAGAVTTPTANMTYRKSTNGTVDTGLWTYPLASLGGFTVGGLYYAHINNTAATPTDQLCKFQFGSDEGDLNVTASDTTGVGYVQAEPRGAAALSSWAVSGTTTLTGAVSAPAGITADITGDLDGSVTGAVILAADGLDAVVTEAGLNARQMVSLIGDVLMGYLSGARPAGAQTIVIKDPTNTTTRVTIQTDAFNNRTSVTLNPPA